MYTTPCFGLTCTATAKSLGASGAMAISACTLKPGGGSSIMRSVVCMVPVLRSVKAKMTSVVLVGTGRVALDHLLHARGLVLVPALSGEAQRRLGGLKLRPRARRGRLQLEDFREQPFALLLRALKRGAEVELHQP